MPEHLSSRERMLGAIRRQEVDHVPCAFMSFSAMRGRCQDPYEVVERELEMGLDSWLFVPATWRNQRPNHPDLRGLPVRLPAEIRTELWSEDVPVEDPVRSPGAVSGGFGSESFPVLHKEYHTPAGTLTTLVRKTDDWPHGNFIPFMDDYQIPRAIKPLVTNRADLDVLRTMLVPPTADDVTALRAEVKRARTFCTQHGVLLASGWGVGADMAAWLCGLQNLMLMVMDDPDFVADLLDVISAWNEQRMRVILESGVDLYIRRGWYESAQFWSPRLYRRFLLPRLQRETALAHEYGIPFGYNMTTGLLPMMDSILETGIDVLLGLDPLQAGADPLQAACDRLGGRICLWGGVNGAITVEEGTTDDVRAAVHRALEVMRGANGFILSPVDNITEITRNTWRNVDVLIETWKQARL